MGAHAARKAAAIVANVAHVLAIEALCAAQALDLRRPLRAGAGVEAARAALRRRVPHLDRDRVQSTLIASALDALEDGSLRRAAERVAGALR
jgi:histidine ammonia-lyase